MKKVIFSTMLFLLVIGNTGALADCYVPINIESHLSVAQMGMGGLTTVVSNKAHTVFYNPAMLNRQGFSIEIVTAGVGLDADAFDVIDFVKDHQDEFDNWDNLLPEDQSQFIKDMEPLDNKWVNVSAGGFIGVTFSHIGIAYSGVARGDLKIDQGVITPAVGLRGYTDRVLGVGIGLPLNIMGSGFELGATARFAQRSVIEPIRINAADASDFGSIGDTLIDEYEDYDKGFFIDVGMIRTIGAGFMGKGASADIGIVLKNLIGNMDGERIKPALQFGIMFHLSAGMTNLDVGGEMVDFFNHQGVNLFQRVNLGAETKLLGSLLGLRCGFHQGYLTYGAGLNLGIFKLDYAYFTRELGEGPGSNPEKTHQAQLSVGF